jgi:hypothetical protein
MDSDRKACFQNYPNQRNNNDDHSLLLTLKRYKDRQRKLTAERKNLMTIYFGRFRPTEKLRK